MNKSKIIAVIVLVMLYFAFLIAMDKALDAQEKVECYRLQEQAEQYKNFLYPENEFGFYITELEKQMCDHHNITINANIK